MLQNLLSELVLVLRYWSFGPVLELVLVLNISILSLGQNLEYWYWYLLRAFRRYWYWFGKIGIVRVWCRSKVQSVMGPERNFRSSSGTSSEISGTGTELVPNSKIWNGTGTERPFFGHFYFRSGTIQFQFHTKFKVLF